MMTDIFQLLQKYIKECIWWTMERVSEWLLFNSMSLHPHTFILISSRPVDVLSGEAANTNFIVFGLTRPGLEPTIYR